MWVWQALVKSQPQFVHCVFVHCTYMCVCLCIQLSCELFVRKLGFTVWQ